jgi:hypothetical protein
MTHPLLSPKGMSSGMSGCNTSWAFTDGAPTEYELHPFMLHFVDYGAFVYFLGLSKRTGGASTVHGA